ncbi:hypothetical protein HYW75_02330 [Candidatus Pacearchaeota archaeon]|nr:hypothetical protein [Candidatus Pacearchaeota archaeon]
MMTSLTMVNSKIVDCNLVNLNTLTDDYLSRIIQRHFMTREKLDLFDRVIEDSHIELISADRNRGYVFTDYPYKGNYVNFIGSLIVEFSKFLGRKVKKRFKDSDSKLEGFYWEVF